MVYQSQEVHLKNPLSFLAHFSEQENFLFYNPQKDLLIMGAKPIFRDKPNSYLPEIPYLFSSMTFFDKIKDPKWKSFGNESIGFAYYLVQQEGKQTIYSNEEKFKLQDLHIPTTKHIFNIMQNDFSNWETLFSAAKKYIHQNKMTKIVISREIPLQCNSKVDVLSIIQQLLQQNVNSFVFAYTKDGKTFLGASPEVLVEKNGDKIITYALAGTASRDDSREQEITNALLEDEKNRREHQIVIDSIRKILQKHMDPIFVDQTQILKLKNLYHLHTKIHGNNSQSSLMEWVTRIHPTPALGGEPLDIALQVIREHETHERGLYAAPIGLTDAHGNGLFIAGIRSALITNQTIYAYVGCGIVEESDCIAEYNETESKFKTILESL